MDINTEMKKNFVLFVKDLAIQKTILYKFFNKNKKKLSDIKR